MCFDLITVRENGFFRRANGNFWVQYKSFHLQLFLDLTSGKMCNFLPVWMHCKDRQKGAVVKCQWNKFTGSCCCSCCLKSIVSERLIMGVYFHFKAKKQGIGAISRELVCLLIGDFYHSPTNRTGSPQGLFENSNLTRHIQNPESTNRWRQKYTYWTEKQPFSLPEKTIIIPL